MATQVQLRRGTTTEHASFTGAVGEVTIDTDKDTVVVHDGSVAGGRALLREDLTNLPAGTIDNADIAANAEIAVSKLADGSARQLLQTDAAGTGVEWASNIDIPGTLDVTDAATFDSSVTVQGDLTVNGTTTTIDTTTLVVEDKNIEMGVVATPTDVTADGGGITLKGSTDKTINWVDATDAWTFSEHVDLASAKEYRIDGTKVLDATSLGSAVVSSSLTSVGTIGTGVWEGTAINKTYLDSTLVSTGDTGTVTSTMIANDTIVNEDINASAAIADTKLDTISTSGKVSNSATTATSANTASAIVARDASGNFSAGTITADLAGNASTVTTNANLTGDVTSVGNATSIAAGVIVDADVNASAAIAGTKISPDFGSQTITTTGVVSAALGAEAAPSITFTGDLNTGIYSPGADQVAISTNSTERVEFGTSEVVFNDGGENYDFRIEGDTNANLFFVDASADKVGIGTTSPQALLHCSTSSTTVTARFEESTKSALLIWHPSAAECGLLADGANQDLVFGTNSAERIRITSTGVVELPIGVSALIGQVATTAHAAGNVGSVGLFVSDGGGSSGVFVHNTHNGTYSSQDIRFLTAEGGVSSTTERARIRSDGMFEVKGAGTAGASPAFSVNGSAPVNSLVIDSLGKVGLGTSAPSDIFHINKASTAATVAYLSNTGGEARIGVENNSGTGVLSGAGAYDTVIRTAASTGISFGIGYSAPAVRIDSSGRLGVGTTTPLAKLTVSSNGAEGIEFLPGFASNVNITQHYNRSGSTYVESRNDAIFHSWYIQGDEKARIDSSGAFHVKGAGTAGVTQAVSFNGSAPVNSLVIDSTGKVGLGTSSPGSLLDLVGGNIRLDSVYGINKSNADGYIHLSGGTSNVLGGTIFCFGQSHTGNANEIHFRNSGNQTRAVIDSSGRLGVGTTSVNTTLEVVNSSTPIIRVGDGTRHVQLWGGSLTQNQAVGTATSAAFNININSSPVATFDTSGRLLVGTSSTLPVYYDSASDWNGIFQVARSDQNAVANFSIWNSTATTYTNYGGVQLHLSACKSGTVGSHTSGALANGDTIGTITFNASDGTNFRNAARIEAVVDAASGTADVPGRLVFSTCADGQSSPTQRMVIKQNGLTAFYNGTPTFAYADAAGFQIAQAGYVMSNVDGERSIFINRKTNDGGLIEFAQDGVVEGSISVSGNTISYNGAHLSRWSQLPSGAERTEILRGSVLSNIDEMCEWGDEDNEQLNRMKVSDVEGDKNVSGVFQAWDDDDDTYTNDFYCAMTGDFIIRVAEGVTVERGDLLMSAGDGTAKPQDDDIIRSKTIAKVTSTNVSCTYDDGSYCVPCVLMAC